MNKRVRPSPSRMKKDAGALARICLARDVVECPECGEPESFLGIFLRQGKADAVHLWRLEWITHAPAEFVRWAAKASLRWRRAQEIYINHCSSCGAPLADPLGFQTDRAWLCDSGIDVAVSTAGRTLSVEGFSPGAVVMPDGRGLWEEALRLTPRDFRRRFRETPRFMGLGRNGLRLALISAAPPHRWRLMEAAPHGRKLEVDQSFFSFSQAKKLAALRWNVPAEAWFLDG